MNENNLESFCRSPEENLELLKLLEKYDSEQSLLAYTECAWKTLEPSREFKQGRAVNAICEHLEAVTSGQIDRLLINVPPGCMKSLTTSVLWPTWEWGAKNMPAMRFVCAAYADHLTTRDNIKARRLIQSEWYQERWGDKFWLVDDQNNKTKFENNHTGWKLATGTQGVGTGERGDRVIIDDPHNVKDGESDAKRNATLMWFTEVMPSRLNDPEKSAIVVIMQRVHELDVSGEIIARELGYEHLCLPMEYESEKHCRTKIGFSDWRKTEGELLWPERFPKHVVERDKKVMGSYAFAGQHQQRPSPRGGGMFKRNWFEVVDEVPSGGKAVRAWDLAASEGENAAYTAGVKLRKVDGIIYVEDMIRFRGSPNKVETTIYNTATQDGHSCIVAGPQDPGQAGKAQKMSYAQKLIGYICRFTPETGSKELRAQSFAAQAEAGNVKVKLGDWNREFFEELEKFPMGAFKDQVDACSRGMMELTKRDSNMDIVPVGVQQIG